MLKMSRARDVIYQQYQHHTSYHAMLGQHVCSAIWKTQQIVKSTLAVDVRYEQFIIFPEEWAVDKIVY